MAEIVFTGQTIEHSGYVFELDAYTINVHDASDGHRVATIPVLDANGHRRIHTTFQFENEVGWWLKDWNLL